MNKVILSLAAILIASSALAASSGHKASSSILVDNPVSERKARLDSDEAYFNRQYAGQMMEIPATDEDMTTMIGKDFAGWVNGRRFRKGPSLSDIKRNFSKNFPAKNLDTEEMELEFNEFLDLYGDRFWAAKEAKGTVLVPRVYTTLPPEAKAVAGAGGASAESGAGGASASAAGTRVSAPTVVARDGKSSARTTKFVAKSWAGDAEIRDNGEGKAAAARGRAWAARREAAASAGAGAGAHEETAEEKRIRIAKMHAESVAEYKRLQDAREAAARRY